MERESSQKRALLSRGARIAGDGADVLNLTVAGGGGTAWRRLSAVAYSLQCKATVLVVALTLVVTAAVSGYLLRSSVKLARTQQNEQLVQLASSVAGAGAGMLARGEREALAVLASKEADAAPLVYVSFTDTDGNELAAARHEGTPWVDPMGRRASRNRSIPGTPFRHQATADHPSFLEVVYPVKAQPTVGDNDTPTRLLGYVSVGMCSDHWDRSMASAVDLIIGLGIIGTAVAVPLGFLLIRRITRPLEEVAHAMLRFSRGELNVRSPAHRNDEIGRLANVFNLMADEHQRAHEHILRMNAELEERVARRTRQLRELALRDPLTGLYNRRHFNEVLEQRFAESLRYDTDLSCMMMDLDHFKTINDKFGHQTGDTILMLMASTIRSQLRTADLGARFGGDEFIVLMPQTGPEDARVLAERIAERFRADISERLPDTRATASIGIASLRPLGVGETTMLIFAADNAMYAAKEAGGNRIVTADVAPQPTPV
jgi:diguanylate cyclase (GGDEF)-like protein